MATTILQTESPSTAPSPSAIFCEHYGCRFAGITRSNPPADECGDWMRVTRVPDGFIACVGDACGHGHQAAPLARLMKIDFDSVVHRGITAPADILHHMNSALHQRRTLAGVTIVYSNGREIVTAAAGAPEPTLFHRGSAEVLPARGRILGFSSCLDLDVVTRDFPPDAIIALHSDGVSETEHPLTGQTFRVERFAEILDPTCSPASNLAACLHAVFAHGPQHDDVSLLLLHASSGPAPTPAIAKFCSRPPLPHNRVASKHALVIA